MNKNHQSLLKFYNEYKILSYDKILTEDGKSLPVYKNFFSTLRK